MTAFFSSSVSFAITISPFLVMTASGFGSSSSLSLMYLSITYSVIPGELARPGDSIDATFMKLGLSSPSGSMMKSFDVELGLTPAKVRIALFRGTSFRILKMLSFIYFIPSSLVAMLASSIGSLLGPIKVFP